MYGIGQNHARISFSIAIFTLITKQLTYRHRPGWDSLKNYQRSELKGSDDEELKKEKRKLRYYALKV